MNQLTTSLWGDEAFTAVAVQENFFRMLNIVMKDTAPPLYYCLLFIWTRIFGHTEVAIRSLSVLLYLATLGVVFLLVKKVWGKNNAFLALLVTLANPFLFPFAFEGRMYSLLVFTVALSFYFFITKNNLGYILSVSLSLYSHHYAILALLFQFFWRLGEIILEKKRGLTPKYLDFFEPYLIIGLLYLPWLYPLSKQVTMVETQGFWLGKPKLIDISNLLVNYLRGPIKYSWQKYWAFLLIPIFIFKKWQKNLRENLILLGTIFTPIFLAFIFSLGKTSIFYDRYLIFIIPAIAIFLAVGYRRLSLALIIIFCLPLLWLNIYYFTHPTKRPFSILAQYVKKEIATYDFLINYNGSSHHLWESKYYGLRAPLYTPGGNLPFYLGTAQMTKTDIISQLPIVGHLGVITSEKPSLVEIPQYQLESYKSFTNLYFCYFIPK